MNPRFHRRSIRLKGFDYTASGAYFVTLVSFRRECLFGQVVEGEMRLDPYGEILRQEWLKTAEIRSNVELHEDEFIIMPNHLHGIIWINAVGATSKVGATCQVAPTSTIAIAPTRSRTLISNSLGAIIGQFKTVTTKRINSLRDAKGLHVWQRNYYEHILRNQRDLENICNYIAANPANWENDEEKR
jgi:REP element-mobilizing transposase RayT